MPKGKGAGGMLGAALEADIEDVKQQSRKEAISDRGEEKVERINITMPQSVLLALDDKVHEEKRKGNRGVSRSSMILEAVKSQFKI